MSNPTIELAEGGVSPGGPPESPSLRRTTEEADCADMAATLARLIGLLRQKEKAAA